MPINDEFQRILGRAPTQEESQFFQRFIDEGHIQPYEVGQFLQSQPEAQQRRLPGMANQYSQYLAQQDEELLNRSGQQLQSQFARQGRSIGGSGYAAAYANAGRDLALARQQPLSAFYGNQLQNISGGYGQGAQSLQRGYGLRDEQRQRNWDVEDYYREQNDLQGQLRGQGVRNMQGALLNTGLNLATRGIGASMGYAGGGGWAGASKGFGLGGWR